MRRRTCGIRPPEKLSSMSAGSRLGGLVIAVVFWMIDRLTELLPERSETGQQHDCRCRAKFRAVRVQTLSSPFPIERLPQQGETTSRPTSQTHQTCPVRLHPSCSPSAGMSCLKRIVYTRIASHGDHFPTVLKTYAASAVRLMGGWCIPPL